MSKASGRTAFLAVGLVAVLLLLFSVFIKPDEPEAEEPIWTIIQPPDDITSWAPMGGTLWVGGKSGVIGVDIVSHETVPLPCDTRFSYVRDLLVEGETLWVAHDNGLTRLSGGDCYTFTLEDGVWEERVTSLYRDTEGVLWAGSASGAFYLEDGEWSKITSEDGLIDDMVNKIEEDDRGGLWFGSYVAPRGGLSILMDGEWTYFTTENGLPHNNINSIYRDVDGSMWIATGLLSVGGAVHFTYTEDGWAIDTVLDHTDGLPMGKIRSIYRDPGGVLWIGHESDGLSIVGEGGVRVLTTEDGLSNNEVKVMWHDPDGNMWLGTRFGITIIYSQELLNIDN